MNKFRITCWLVMGLLPFAVMFGLKDALSGWHVTGLGIAAAIFLLLAVVELTPTYSSTKITTEGLAALGEEIKGNAPRGFSFTVGICGEVRFSTGFGYEVVLREQTQSIFDTWTVASTMAIGFDPVEWPVNLVSMQDARNVLELTRFLDTPSRKLDNVQKAQYARSS